VAKLFSKRHVLIKLNLILVNYSSESVHERIRPNPDICKLVSVAELASLSKETALLDEMETLFKDTRAAFEGPLINSTSSLRASNLIHDFEMQVTRMALGKKPLDVFDPDCATGKLTTEKLHTISDNWVKYLQNSLKHVNIFEATGYKLFNPDLAEHPAASDEVDR